jgi:RimJ/RimL family protein N-acetyltransferase
VSGEGVVVGRTVSLEPITADNAEEAQPLLVSRHHSPEMAEAVIPGTDMAGAMLVRDLRSGEAVGLVEAAPLPGYPGVAVVSAFMDRTRLRPGPGVEAVQLFVERLFEGGVRLIHMPILEFNRPVLRVFRRVAEWRQAVLREHAYVGGRFWDVHVYAFDREQWEEKKAGVKRDSEGIRFRAAGGPKVG